MNCPPENSRYIGTDAFWNSLVEDSEGRIWVGLFDRFTKRTDWRLKQ